MWKALEIRPVIVANHAFGPSGEFFLCSRRPAGSACHALPGLAWFAFLSSHRPTRSGKEMAKQSGNAMNANAVGVALLFRTVRGDLRDNNNG